jgi:hypothetical protein
VPQLHWPEVHPSAMNAVHETHAAPEVPQLPSDGASQLAPAQQPDAQLVEVHDVHALPTQFCSAGHAEQLVPPEPQAAFEVPGRHVVPEQQPSGQDVPSQTHAPLTHRWPLEQAAPVPQVQVPPLLQVSAVEPQVAQAPPAVPQLVRVCASQTPLWQQPPGHEVALQVHAPPTHAWPCAHSAPPPHEQEPVVQPSERSVSQAWHAAPPVPQVDSVAARQVTPFWQQPVAHDAALHTHLPATHCWPCTHGLPVPHAHSPIALQLSAATVLHATQASPPKPHALVERALHVGPEQQPVAHVAAHPVQTPFMQLSPPGQLAHALPPLPQAPPVLPGWHVLPEQHPVAHDVPSHTQEPLRQRWPTTHAAPVPHMHAPLAEHESAAATVQIPHFMPGAPQLDSDSAVHAPFMQQPVGHDVASQVHTPCEQCRPALHGAPVPQ